jgi:ATP-binding cassette subfamily B protein
LPRRRTPVAGLATGVDVNLARLRRVAAVNWQSGHLWLVGLVAGTIVAGLVPVSIAWLTRSLLNTLVLVDQSSRIAHALLLVISIAAVTLVANVIPQLTQYAQSSLARRTALITQGRLFSAINSDPGLRQFEDPIFYDRLRLVQQVGQGAPSQVLQVALQLLQGITMMIAFLGALLVFGWQLCLIVAAASVPGMLLQWRLNRLRSETAWRNAAHTRLQFFYAMLQSDQQAAREIRLFDFGHFLHERMQSQLKAVNRASASLEKRELYVDNVGLTLSAAVSGLAFIYVVLQVAEGHLPIGDVALFAAAALGLQAGFGSLLQAIIQGQQALINYGHYEALLEQGPSIQRTATTSIPKRLKTCVSIENLWFRYGDDHPWVLRGVTLEVPLGKTVALVGLNGAGKSTLVKLLARFYDPAIGRISWDGEDIRTFDPVDLRRHLSIVFQAFMCYEFSARENIAVGDLRYLNDTGRIRAAANGADLAGVIERLPQGYETLLSRIFVTGEAEGAEPGIRLSGGQWQRIAIARALLREDCELLVLDEPSAGLDPEAEHFVHERLRSLREGRASLLISQRLNAVKDADEIVVLSGGELVERGTHEGLIDMRGEYARLFEMQALGYASA